MKTAEPVDSFMETKFTLFSQKKIDSSINDDSNSISDSSGQKYSIYSYLSESKSDLDTPLANNRNSSLMWNDETNFCASPVKKNTEYSDKDESFLDFGKKGAKPNEKQAPLTCSKTKPNKNYFEVDKQPLYSPQNLSNLIFNPNKKSNTRLTMTLNFLKDKLGLDRFEKINEDYKSRGYNKEYIASLLKPSETEFIKIIEYVFNEQSPSTQDSGSLDLDMANMRF